MIDTLQWPHGAPDGPGARLYRKPLEICRVSPRWEDATSPRETARFIAVRKRRIEDEIGRMGLRLRVAGLQDLDALHRFHLERFRPTPARTINAYELYRILLYGRALVLEPRGGGEVLGYDLASEYGGDGETTQGTAGIAVHASLAGRNLAALLVTWSALCGMEAGAATRRGIVSPRNYASLATLLNHVGAVCDGFHREFANWGEPRFSHCCPLTPGGLSNNGIDPRKLAAFLADARPGLDYELVSCDDDAGIAGLYRETDFRVAALLKPESAGASPGLVALPARRLGIPVPGR
jgi:hypothetical protein